MPSPRRRAKRLRTRLTAPERLYLMHGHVTGDEDGFAFEDRLGQFDEAAARAAWTQFRDELTADAAEHGLVPWAAREFEGASGRSSVYEDLRLDGGGQ